MLRKSWVLAGLLLLVPAVAGAGPLTSLYVFGDSLSDSGNGFLLTGGTFPPAPYVQRASNGPVAVERLAADLGIALAPSVAGGTNYAVVGATTGTGSIAPAAYGQLALANTGLATQVASFLLTSPTIDPASSLFFLWGGANELLTPNPTPALAVGAVANLAGEITALYGAGARQFLVPNLPDLSLTPYGLSLPAPLQMDLRNLSIFFDTLLAQTLTGLSAQLPGIDITPFNTFALLTAISANPGNFGFANASAPCLTGILVGGVVCPDPASFVFWDSVHPTTAADRVLGDAFANAVPEPATMTLVGLGLAVSALVRRRV